MRYSQSPESHVYSDPVSRQSVNKVLEHIRLKASVGGLEGETGFFSALNMPSSRVRWLLHVDEKAIKPSMYTNRPIFGRTCEKIRVVILEQMRGRIPSQTTGD